ncbi:hypothetical protein P0Y35_16270 [Kiritimatiellaeota bacterium B1221]|nr:hypothetical protein [Kiritimatiellaeota bacterium B1221]
MNRKTFLLMRPLCLLILLYCLPATIASANVLGITTTDDSILNTVTIHRNGSEYTYNESELIGVTLSSFQGDSGSVVLVGDGDAAPATGSRAALLSDNRIDTGIINPEEITTAMTLDFHTPVVNGPGVDMIWFEIDNDPSNGDLFRARIGSNFVLNIGHDAKVISDNLIQNDVYLSDNGTVTTLNTLENDPFSYVVSVTSGLFAYSLDFSDLGIADSATVSSIQIGSQSDGGSAADPVYFAGLHTIPEPSSLFLLVGGFLLTFFLRPRG